jgi:serine phosphatase RsbU (regulator of sigma subunit)
MTPSMSTSPAVRARIPLPRSGRGPCSPAAARQEELLLPPPASIAALGCLRIAVRYLAAGAPPGSAGGDWYLAVPVPDGRILISVGDVAGHGRAAVPGMLRLLHGLAGLSVTGAPPQALMGWLNTIVQASGPDHAASAVAGHVDPGGRAFTWAQAGHPPPILVRDGAPRVLARPDGVLLGCADAGYQAITTRLRPGDLILLYSDGLAERRDLPVDNGIAAILAAARGHRDPESAASAVVRATGTGSREDDVCLLAFQVAG